MPATGPNHNNCTPIISPLFPILTLLSVLLRTTYCNSVALALSSTSLSVAASSNVTAAVDRTRALDGTVITPANVNTSTYSIVVVLDAAYKLNVSSAIAVSSSTNWTVDLSTNTFTVRMQSPLLPSYSISILNVRNPLVSLTPLTTMVYFKDANGNTIDQAYNTLTYNFLLFSQADIVASFSPANVSTISSLSLMVNSSVYNAGAGLYLEVSFRRWWMRSLSNTSSTAIFSSTSSCVPSCAITYQTQATLVLFSSASLSQANIANSALLNLTFINIQSPPTLEPIDQIQLILRQPTTSTVLQKIDNLLISTALPNSLQSLTPATASFITEVVSLQVTVISRNLFGPNDTIIIKFNPDSRMTSTDPANVVLTSPLIYGYTVNIQDFYTVVISSFAFVSANYAPLNAQITIGKIVSAPSTKPRTNNVIELRRNGYLFNTGYFQYQVVEGIISNITITLDNNYANSQATCTWQISFSTGVSQTDMVYLNIHQSISISTCQPQCQGCSCSITLPTSVNPFTSLLISIPSSQVSPLYSLVISASVRNPIQSPPAAISVCSTDYLNYTKQCGNVSYPTMVQASISSAVLSVSVGNPTVYGIGTYTFYYNFSQYDLQNGYLITVLPSQLTLIDSNNLICKINGQPQCRLLTVNSSGTYLNTTVSSFTKIYTLIVSNLRNPATTEPFTVAAKVAYITNEIYYSVTSDYLGATVPYTLLLGTHFSASSSNCTNSELSTLSVSFVPANLPFDPTVQLASMAYLQYRINSSKSNSTTTLLYANTGAPLLFAHRNWYTMEPVEYTFVMYTGNLLYSVWQFKITQQNCLPQSVPIIGYQFGGLPEDTGTLTIAYTHRYLTEIDSTNASYSVRLTFPPEYPVSLSLSSNPSQLSVTSLSPRTFLLHPLVSQQPIILQLSSSTNVLNINNNYTNNALLLQILVNGYLVAQDNTTIVYRLAQVSDCAFPCKVCSAGNGVSTGTCLSCYSSAITNSYLLAAAGGGRCVSACPTSTYQNSTINACVACPVSCSACNSASACSSCTNNYYLFNQSCVTDCPSGWYPITLSQSCSACSSPCLACTSPQLCRSCQSGFSLFNSTSCVTSCPTGYLAQVVNGSSICFACLSPCVQCSGVLSACTRCMTGFYLDQGGVCAITCSGLAIGYQGVCTVCSGTCYRCVDVPSKCMSCASPYVLHQSACITNCPAFYYPANQTCLACSPECSACASSTNCSLCSASFIYYQSYCWSSCPTSMFTSVATITMPGTNASMTRLECQPCALASCLSCSNSAENCVVCANGWYLYQSTCLTACPVGMYALGHTCASCSSGCLSCLSSSQCISCALQYALYAGTCVSACPASMVRLNNTCQLCSSFILNCQSCTPLGCTSCTSSYYLLPNASSPSFASCILQCPAAYLPSTLNNISQCIPCSLGCQSCSVLSTNCTACLNGYLMYLNSCVTGCPTGMVAADSICVSCQTPCLTCSHNNTQYCESCINSLYLLVNNATRQCVVDCPEGYYQQNSTRVCMQCSVGCTSCVSSGCLSCSAGYFVRVRSNTTVNNATMVLYDCFSTCPDYFPFVTPPNMCSACSEHCLQCQSSSSNFACLQCAHPYLIYTQYCVLTCPSPYQASSTSTQCIIVDNNSTNNNTSNTTNNTTTNTSNSTNTTANSSSMPVVPFSIATGVGVLLAAVSKLQYTWSNWVMTALAITCLLVPICEAVYLALVWVKISSMTILGQTATNSDTITTTSYMSVRIGLYLLIISLALIYLTNFLHLVFSFATYRKDSAFVKYVRKHPWANRIIFLLALIFQHMIFVLYFCRWFNFSVFRAGLQTLHSLSCLNYIWGLALVGNIIGIVSGILLIVTDTTLLLPGIDLIIVNAIVLILGLLLFRKNKGSGWLQDDYLQQPGYEPSEDDYSSKKVVMLNHEGDSDAQIANIFGEQEEINGKISKRPFLQTQNKVQPGKDEGQQNKEDKQQDKDFYFEEGNGDDLSPNKPSQAQTEGNKKSNGSEQNSPDNDIYSSQGTNPMKIEPSINMLFTADQMKPGHAHQDMNQDMVERGADSNVMGNSNSWAKQKQERSSIMLRNQSKISPHSNIFDGEDPESPEHHKNKYSAQQSSQNFNQDKNQSVFSNNNEDNKAQKSNKLINSQNSSKSLKATPRSNKQEKGDSPTLQNLAAAGLNKSRKSGGRSSQQFTSMQSVDSQPSNKKTEKVGKKYSLDQRKLHEDNNRPTNRLSRTGSRVSNRISSSNLMGIIEEENEDQLGRNKDKHADHQQQQKKEPVTIIATGADRFLSNTLQEDDKMEAVSEYEADKSTVSLEYSPRRQSNLLFMRQSKQSFGSQLSGRKSSKSKSPQLNDKQQSPKLSIQREHFQKQQLSINHVIQAPQIEQNKSKNYTFGSKHSSPANPQLLKFQSTSKSHQSQEDIAEIEYHLGIVKQRESEDNKKNIVSPRRKILLNFQQREQISQIERGQVQKVEQEKQLDKHNAKKLVNLNLKVGKKLETSTIKNKYVSAGTIPAINKLQSKEIDRARQNATIDDRSHSTSKRKQIKAFRSRNISVDKLRPSTSGQSSIMNDDDDEYVRVNTRALMKQIQRKQKIRNHQESLKKIYLSMGPK